MPALSNTIRGLQKKSSSFKRSWRHTVMARLQQQQVAANAKKLRVARDTGKTLRFRAFYMARAVDSSLGDVGSGLVRWQNTGACPVLKP
eukprot:10585992-Lingulodinium_polyedra.AAC.1